MALPHGQRVSRLASLADIHRRIEAHTKPVAPRTVALSAAAGRVLAQDVVLEAALPIRMTALRDGWAVNAEAIADAGPYAPVALAPPPAWIHVGEDLPAGADAVLSPDAVVVSGESAEVHEAVPAGEGVLAAGEDGAANAVLRRAGEMLRATDVAALRAAGLRRVMVREPQLRIVSANPGIERESDAAGPLIARAIEAEGGNAILDRVRDSPVSLDQALGAASAAAVVVIGGTGAGRNDASVQALARAGRVELHGMGVRPGESAAFGVARERPVLLLPGRLDGALAVWLAVGRRLLAALSGQTAAQPAKPVALTRKVVSAIGIADVVLLAPDGEGMEPLASGYFPLQALMRAQGWLLVPPESEGFQSGATVDMYPLP